MQITWARNKNVELTMQITWARNKNVELTMQITDSFIQMFLVLKQHFRCKLITAFAKVFSSLTSSIMLQTFIYINYPLFMISLFMFNFYFTNVPCTYCTWTSIERVCNAWRFVITDMVISERVNLNFALNIQSFSFAIFWKLIFFSKI